MDKDQQDKKGDNKSTIGGQPVQPKLNYEQLKASLREDLEFLDLKAKVQKARAEIATFTWAEIQANHQILNYKMEQQAAQANADKKGSEKSEEK